MLHKSKYIYTGKFYVGRKNVEPDDASANKRDWILCIGIYITSIAHRIKNLLRRMSEHIAIIYFHTFTYGPRVNCERASLRSERTPSAPSLRLQSLLSTVWFNFFWHIIVVKPEFYSILHKIVSVKEISSTYICK